MEYFQLKQDTDYTDAPVIPDVIRQIDRRNITPEQASNIKKMTIFPIDGNEPLDFIDLLDRQLFLISDSLKATFTLYVPKLIFKIVVLVEPESQVNQSYYLPIFSPVDCIADTSVMTRDHSKVTHLVLKKDSIGNSPIFRVQHKEDMIIVARLDAAESILRRRFRGIEMKRVELA